MHVIATSTGNSAEKRYMTRKVSNVPESSLTYLLMLEENYSCLFKILIKYTCITECKQYIEEKFQKGNVIFNQE